MLYPASIRFIWFFYVENCWLSLQKICEKPQVIGDYEAGRGIPNNDILGKIERVIGIKLRGKDRGKPMLPPKKWTTLGG